MPKDTGASHPIPGVRGPSEIRVEQRSARRRVVASAVVAALVLAAALGAAGSGPLSWATRTDAQLHVSYERVAREGAPWRLQVEAPVPEEGPLRILIDREFLDAHRVERVTPAPASVTVDGDDFAYTFENVQAGSASVSFALRGDAFGLREGLVRAGDAGPISFRQLILP